MLLFAIFFHPFIAAAEDVMMRDHAAGVTITYDGIVSEEVRAEVGYRVAFAYIIKIFNFIYQFFLHLATQTRTKRRLWQPVRTV